MARVFITGSTDGLGRMAAELLIEQGHDVVLHARSAQRAADVQRRIPAARAVVIGDLASLTQTRSVAEQVNRLGRMDAVIHNAAVGYQEPRRQTDDGLPHVFAINVLAPYLLTALIERPQRLVYLSSGMHRGASVHVDDIAWQRRAWQGAGAYAESKLLDVLLAFGVARRWPEVHSNALEPGWVATRMGGPGAPDDLDQGHRTQAWLAVGDDPGARVSGAYFFHMRRREAAATASDPAMQEALFEACAGLSGVRLG